jgi:hypothetical protein
VRRASNERHIRDECRGLEAEGVPHDLLSIPAGRLRTNMMPSDRRSVAGTMPVRVHHCCAGRAWQMRCSPSSSATDPVARSLYNTTLKEGAQ